MILNDTLDQLDLININRTFHPQTAEYIFFSSTWNVLQISHKLDRRITLNTFKRMEIISGLFFWHNDMHLEIICRKKNGKSINTWGTCFLKTNNSMKKSKRKSENTSRQMKVATQLFKICGIQQRLFQEESW